LRSADAICGGTFSIKHQVGAELCKILAEARAAQKMPWDG
jgi:hypothetical protein